MKKIRNIYQEIISKENLYCSAHMASKGRRYRDTVADFNFLLEEEVERLHGELAEKTYCHGKYRLFSVYEPKERGIAAAPFRDRVVHHAVHDVIEPLIDRSFIYHSYACRKGKGTHLAVDKAQSFLRANKYCFHGDIKKYFPSIDHNILKKLVEKKVEDRDLLWLLNEIIDSARQLNKSGRQRTENRGQKAEGGKQKTEDRGLPIGNLTSQFFANLYLNELDYFVKFSLKFHYHIRYMDDFVIFNNSKEALQELKNKIRGFLETKLNLNMHEGKSQIYQTKKGIKFLGFVLFKDHRRLTSDNVRRFKKRLKRFEYLLDKGEIGLDEVKDSVRAWVAHSKYADTKRLRFNIWNNLEIGEPALSLRGSPSLCSRVNSATAAIPDQFAG